jgi:Transposase DDE domain
MLKVISRLGREHTWLFDRGFDAIDFLQTLMTLRIHWVVRQTQSRHVLLSDGELVPMHLLAAGLRKPHAIEVPYVDKSNHEPKFAPASFGFAPVRLPGIDAALTMIVIDGGRDEDIVLLTNARITNADQAEQIVLAYLRRWGSEEATRALKQLTGVEDFRVRKWESIQRLTFLAMMTCGVQALMLLTRARTATRYIARIAQFFDNVLLKNYRLWDGIADALLHGA